MGEISYLWKPGGKSDEAQPTYGELGWVSGARPISPAEVKIREELIQNGQLRIVRLWPGYGNDWPLWEAGIGPIEPCDLGLCEEVARDLKAWGMEWKHASDAQINDGECVHEGQLLDSSWFAKGEVLCRVLAGEIWNQAVLIPSFRSYWGKS